MTHFKVLHLFYQVRTPARLRFERKIHFICSFCHVFRDVQPTLLTGFKCERVRWAYNHAKVSNHKMFIKMLEKYLQNAQTLCECVCARMLTINSNYTRNANTYTHIKREHTEKEQRERSDVHTNKYFQKTSVVRFKCWNVSWEVNLKGGKMVWAVKRVQIILECMLGKLMLLWCDPAKGGHIQQQQ